MLSFLTYLPDKASSFKPQHKHFTEMDLLLLGTCKRRIVRKMPWTVMDWTYTHFFFCVPVIKFRCFLEIMSYSCHCHVFSWEEEPENILSSQHQHLCIHPWQCHKLESHPWLQDVSSAFWKCFQEVKNSKIPLKYLKKTQTPSFFVPLSGLKVA